MKYIFITIRIKEFETDLKIPAEMNTAELIEALSKSYKLSLPPVCKIQAEPIGRILDNSKSFAEQGVDNGAALTVVL